jgi:hypothetical protein
MAQAAMGAKPAAVGTNVTSSTGAIQTDTDHGGSVGAFAMARTTIEAPAPVNFRDRSTSARSPTRHRRPAVAFGRQP